MNIFACLFVWKKASSQNTATNNQNSPESIDAEDVQSKLQSQELSAGEQQEQSGKIWTHTWHDYPSQFVSWTRKTEI